jgi:hypothetical protein
MSKVIVYERPADGGVDVVLPAAGARRPGEGEDDWLARVALAAVPTGVAWRSIERGELPASRRWREAWRMTAGGVVVDLTAARSVREQELRARRETVLSELREAIEAAEDGGETARLVNLRQRRRAIRALDATLAGRLAELHTTEELEQYVPAELADEV